MNPKYLTVLFLFLCNLTFAQKYVFVDKDLRIVKHEQDIIEFLLKDNQFGTVDTPFNWSDYRFSITVKKRLEIYDQSQKAILLIKFRSLGDHADEYCGLITQNDEFFFHRIDDKEFIRFCKIVNDPKVAEIIKNYLIEYPVDEYHGHIFTLEKNTDTVK